MRHVATRLAAATALSLALAACSGEPEVREPDPTPTSAQPTPSITPPPKPPQFDDESAEGAVARVYYWIALLNHAAITGEAEELLDLSSDCAECNDFATSAQGLKAGERPSEDIWNVKDVSVLSGPDSTDVTVSLDLLGGEKSEVVFELSAGAPYVIQDLKRYDS